MAWLLLLVLGVPVADIVLDVLIAREHGWFPLFVWSLLTFLLGLVVLRYAAPITLFRATNRLRKGGVPTRELLDGLLMLAGGLYLLFPGPVSDVLAVVFITPVLRRGPRWLLMRRFARRSRATAAEESGPVDVSDYRME